ncbi:hypothetical protein QTP88_000639 [Uroleucon formosanum]
MPRSSISSDCPEFIDTLSQLIYQKKTIVKEKNHSQEMNNKFDEVLTLVGEKLKFSNSEDAHDITGKNIAGKLRTLEPMMRIYAEKIIYDALFEAQCAP